MAHLRAESVAHFERNFHSEYISFSFSGNFAQITFELLDLQGRKLITKEVRNNETVNLEGLDNGIYVYNLFHTYGKRQCGKLIKE